MARNLGIPYTEKKPFYFISYNTEDEKKVSSYAEALSKFEFPLWYDCGLKVGEAWEIEIAEKIDSCQAVIMFLSKNIFLKENSYVHKEFELATEYSMKNVYVMMLDEIAKPEVPIRFRSWWTNVTKLQCINTYEYTSPEECARKLAEDIGFIKKNDLYVKKNKPETENTDQMTILKNDVLKEVKVKGQQVKKDFSNKEIELVLRRLRMCAQSYGIDLLDELDSFVNWLVTVCKSSLETAYQYSRTIIYISKDLIDMDICHIPLYKVNNNELLRLIFEQIKTNRKIQSNNYMKKQGNSVIEMYYQFLFKESSNSKGAFSHEKVPSVHKFQINDEINSLYVRLKMCANIYELTLDDELDVFVLWLFNVREFSANRIYQYARILIRISKEIMDFGFCDVPLYKVNDILLLNKIANSYINTLKKQNNSEEKKLFDTTLTLYCDFISDMRR